MKERNYWSGVVDALALVAITILILLAALLAGCTHSHRRPLATKTTAPGCDYIVVDVELVDLENGGTP